MAPTHEKSNQEKRSLTKLRGPTDETRTSARVFDACPKAKQLPLKKYEGQDDGASRPRGQEQKQMSRRPHRSPGAEKCNGADLKFQEGAEGQA